MVLTRTLETASTGRFLTIYFFLHFLASEPEPAEPEPAESGVVTEPLEPNWLDQEPTRTEPNRPFPAFWPPFGEPGKPRAHGNGLYGPESDLA